MCEASVDLEATFIKRKMFAITTDEVEERVDTVGNLEEESSSVGDSEREETDPRVKQEVGEIVKAI